VSEQTYTIGELARRTGVAASAIRYYEELGLLPPPPRVAGKRRYNQASVDSVGMILLLRDIGFSLAEIRCFIAACSGSPDTCRELTRHKITELDSFIYRAQVARIALAHQLACPHADVRDCPNFAQVLAARLAGKPLEEAHSH
jgi:DNA-binding transcriptional MerR regulator